LLFLLFAGESWVQAASEKPVRRMTITVNYTENTWWLLSWSDNELLCQIVTDHEGLPTSEEVGAACGGDLQEEWLATPPCTSATDGGELVTSCEGLYLFLASSQANSKEVVIDLPVPEMWVALDGCTLTPPDNRCTNLPNLMLTAEEPLPNEQITEIKGLYDGLPFSCPGSPCILPLQATPLDGVTVEFWVTSTYGDESEHYTARVRVIDTGVSAAPDSGGWYVDIISDRWKGAPLPVCAQIWESFPPIGAPPNWLSTPDSNELMASDEPYYYLAGRLISSGQVDAAECQNAGLLPNGYANACGLEKARPMVEAWQNQFDARIIQVAKETGVPAQLMKNLFAQESQFWPGVFRVRYEYGLGQLTEKGTDAIFIWDPEFFKEFCPLVLSESACSQGYLHLSAEDQAILRGALALQAKTDCQDCEVGIDLTIADDSVSLFASTLVANCSQIGQSIYTQTGGLTPGEISSYEDLWRFTVANYQAGPGCTSYAMYLAWSATGALTWDEVKANLNGDDPRLANCKGVVPYVEKISR
jgi:hypothetical protein